MSISSVRRLRKSTSMSSVQRSLRNKHYKLLFERMQFCQSWKPLLRLQRILLIPSTAQKLFPGSHLKTFYSSCTQRFLVTTNGRRKIARRCGVPSSVWELSSATKAIGMQGAAVRFGARAGDRVLEDYWDPNLGAADSGCYERLRLLACSKPLSGGQRCSAVQCFFN